MKKLLSLLLIILSILCIMTGCITKKRPLETPLLYVRSNTEKVMLVNGKEVVVKYAENTLTLSPDGKFVYYLVDVENHPYDEDPITGMALYDTEGTLVYAPISDVNNYIVVDENVSPGVSFFNGFLRYSKFDPSLKITEFFYSADGKTPGSQKVFPAIPKPIYSTSDMEAAIGIDKDLNLIIQDLQGNVTLIAEKVRWAYPENIDEIIFNDRRLYFNPDGDIYYFTENDDLYLYSEEESLLIDTEVYQISAYQEDFSVMYTKKNNNSSLTVYSCKNGKSSQILSDVDHVDFGFFENFAYNEPIDNSLFPYPNLHYISKSQGKAHYLGDSIVYCRSKADENCHVFTVKKDGNNKIITCYTETEDDFIITKECVFDRSDEITRITLEEDVLCVNSIYYYIADKWVEINSSVYIAKDMLYFITEDNTLYQISIENGKKKLVAQKVTESEIVNDKWYFLVNFDEDTQTGQIYCADNDKIIAEDVSCLGKFTIFNYPECSQCGVEILNHDKIRYNAELATLCIYCFDDNLEEATQEITQ